MLEKQTPKSVDVLDNCNISSGRSICHTYWRKVHELSRRPEPWSEFFWFPMFCCLRCIPARQKHCRALRLKTGKAPQWATDMISSPVASAKVYRIHRVIGRYQGVLPQEARRYYACLLYFTGCVCWNWPGSRGYDLPGVMLRGHTGPVIMRITSKMAATLPFSFRDILCRHSSWLAPCNNSIITPKSSNIYTVLKRSRL